MSGGKIELTLTVNGAEVGPILVPEDMLVIDFLHETLALTGTKFGCGIGECQACTIAVRDRAESEPVTKRACKTSVARLDGKHLTTVEGLADGGTLSDIQQAFLDHYAFQCGYCTPGFLMAASVFLENLHRQGTGIAPEELEEAILDAIGWNLCRCTGYVKYVAAVREVVEKAGLVQTNADP